MIRSLSADELAWFLGRAYAFLGQSDASNFALKQSKKIKDIEAAADQSFILLEANKAVAGVQVLSSQESQDNKNLELIKLWYEKTEQLEPLLRQVFARFRYEAVYMPLFDYSETHIKDMLDSFEALGFQLETACDLSFELSDLPPLGLPLVLEAWTHEVDDLFEAIYKQAETRTISEEYWAWMKRWRGEFQPDLWFVGRETLDQDPIGYGFFGAKRQGIDGLYYLTAIGAIAEHRESSEMLRRLVLSCMLELASRSPLGAIETTLAMNDAKFVQIFESIGFITKNRYKRFVRRPT